MASSCSICLLEDPRDPFPELTSLDRAILNKHVDCVKALIADGHSVSEPNESGQLPIELAVSGSDLSCIKAITDGGANVKTLVRGSNALSRATGRGAHVDFLKFLLENGADPRELDRDGKPVLHYAMTLERAEILISYGADVNAPDSRGDTPLMSIVDDAIHYPFDDVPATMLALIRAGADVNARSDNGETALMMAREVRLAKVLVENGADVNAKCNAGATALIWAAKFRFRNDLVQFLIERGADVNSADEDGCTALMHAAKNDSAASAALLVSAGANVNEYDNEGETPLIKTSGCEEIVNLLIDAGANVNAISRSGFTPLNKALYFFSLSNRTNNKYKAVACLLAHRGAVLTPHTCVSAEILCDFGRWMSDLARESFEENEKLKNDIAEKDNTLQDYAEFLNYNDQAEDAEMVAVNCRNKACEKLNHIRNGKEMTSQIKRRRQ